MGCRISNLLHLPVACHCKWAELIVIGETITMKPVHITLWLVVVCSLCLQASEAVTAADGGHPTEIAKLRAQLKDHAQLLTETRKREAETRKREAETRKREAVLEQQVRELMQERLPGSQPKLGQSNVVAQKLLSETRKREAVLEQQVRELMQERLPGSQPKLGQSNVVAQKLLSETRKREAVLEQQVRELMQERLPGSQPKLGQSNVVAAATGYMDANKVTIDAMEATTKVKTKIDDLGEKVIEKTAAKKKKKKEKKKKPADWRSAHQSCLLPVSRRGHFNFKDKQTKQSTRACSVSLMHPFPWLSPNMAHGSSGHVMPPNSGTRSSA